MRGYAHRVSLGELFEHRPRYDATSSGRRVVGFVPETLAIDVSNDVEEVALLEGELTGVLSAVARSSPDDAGRRRQVNGDLGKRWAGNRG